MAQYGSQRPRNVPHPTAGPGRDVSDRDAFNYIFGQDRPSAMRAQAAAPRPSQPTSERAQTMGANTAMMMQQQQQQQRMPPPRQPQQYSQDLPSVNGYQIPNGTAAPPPIPQDRRVPSLPQSLSSGQTPSGPLPNRQPYTPPRVDSRPAYTPNATQKPVPNRGPPSSAPAPALSSDAYRTQSLATNSRPPPFRSGPGYNPGTANAFRQQPYKMSHTTAQGRAIPERHDERTMSMSSFARDADFSQTASGRVIPSRRRESGAQEPRESTDTEHTLVQQKPLPNDGRSMSMASTLTAPTDRSLSLMSSTTRPSLGTVSGKSSSRRRAPLVYPALLSKVAKCFRERVNLTDKQKDGLVYKNAFTGTEAVDLIAYVMQTTDRNLALLLGRSLDAQKFFHDVTYDHRLRDSYNELYQFREVLDEDDMDVNGVFTLTTECYSPTCTPDRLCYSIACPKRIDQQKRLNMKPLPGLQRQASHESLHEDNNDEQKLWINTVSKEVADSVSDKEKKRQEVISELCYTERDFVKDLEYLQDFWVTPLRTTYAGKPQVINEYRRESFIRQVFANFAEIYAVNLRLAEALTRRQQQNPVVRNVGDVLLEYVSHFNPPYITYGANQLWGKTAYEEEKKENPWFKKFADETERLKESRKLELNGYLTKPTTRLARYPLLLESVLKATADGNPDKTDLPKAIEKIRAVLVQVNKASGQQENRFQLRSIEKSLIYKPGETYDLHLMEEGRELLFKAALKKSPTDNNADIITYLFDNYLLFARAKQTSKKEELRVYKKPIPLGLLVINQMDEVIPKVGLAKRPSSSLIPGARRQETNNTPKPDTKQQQGHPLTFKSLGKHSYEVTLYATSQFQREKYIKLVNEQQEKMRDHKGIFQKGIVSEGFFNLNTKITSGVPIDFGRKFVVGTDAGVYVIDRKSVAKPRRVLDVKAVTQVDVLEQHSILLVLTEKTLYSYSASVLDPDDNVLSAKRGRKISGCNFFKVGVFEGQHLVCCVKTSAMSGTVKVYRPMETMSSQKKKGGFSNLFAGGQDVLRPFKVTIARVHLGSAKLISFCRSSMSQRKPIQFTSSDHPCVSAVHVALKSSPWTISLHKVLLTMQIRLWTLLL